jgi:hypothetical protein
VIFHWPPAYTSSVFHSSPHHPPPKVHALFDLSLETIGLFFSPRRPAAKSAPPVCPRSAYGMMD